MTHTVVDGLAAKYPKIRNGVNHVVGGNIIEFEAYNIKRAGILEGWKEGLEEGLEKGLEEGLEKGLEQGRDEGLREGAAAAYTATAERMIGAGKSGHEISLFTNLTRKEIDAIALQLNRSVDWSETSA